MWQNEVIFTTKTFLDWLNLDLEKRIKLLKAYFVKIYLNYYLWMSQ